MYAGARRMGLMADLADYGMTAVELDVTKGADNERVVNQVIEGWSDCLRLETAPFNIQVVLVEPGLIKTDFGDVAGAELNTRSPSPNAARWPQYD